MKYHSEYRNISLAGLGSTQFWRRSCPEAFKCMRNAVENHGVTLIDTAELYKDGECEKSVSEALSGVERERYYLLGKVLPWNAGKDKIEASLKRSLDNLKTDHFDLYLLHWREDADLQEFVDEAERFVKEGLILHWGVSNFDTDDMKDLLTCRNGENCFCDQILYNIATRGPEYDLLPFLREHHIMPMAYSATDSHRSGKDVLSNNPVIKHICEETGLSVPAIMLRFVSRFDDMPALFSTCSCEHLEENLKFFDFDINRYMDLIDREFPAPDHKTPLDKI
ncbi:MAG: aldo/keto reductase [Erysipelotrichaceae bacterium]|nr:aldo/keto reductase [Erysipelotrichaceae bacterium]